MTDQELQDLRQWAAEKVMGWKAKEVDIADNPAYDGELGVYIVEVYSLDPYIRVDDWTPDTDLNQTFMVVEQMRELGFIFTITCWPGANVDEENYIYRVFFAPDATLNPSVGKDNNPALAILLAARKAVEGQE